MNVNPRGPAPGGPKPLRQEDVKFIAVHCSATPPSQDIGFKEIDRMHRLRGFLYCGYHYIIRRDGSIETGRTLTQRGSHVEDFNDCSIGVCLVGGVDTKLKPAANFTDSQLDSLRGVVQTLQDLFPGAVVQGHRDFPNVAKACPSFDVRHWLSTKTLKP
jgi:N-acetylmuramoyl-L-alanine amidase